MKPEDSTHKRPIWYVPLLSLLAAIFGTTLTLLVESGFQKRTTATTEMASPAIGRSPAAVPVDKPALQSRSLQESLPDSLPAMLSQFVEASPAKEETRDRVEFPTPSAIADSTSAAIAQSIESESQPKISVPPPVAIGDRPSVPEPETLEPETESDLVAKRKRVSAIAAVGKRVMKPMKNTQTETRDRRSKNEETLPLFNNSPAEIEQNQTTPPRNLQPAPAIAPSPIESDPDPEIVEGIRLTLADVVALALQNNRDLKNAYLERIAQREQLAVELDKFKPDFTPEISFSVNRDRLGDGTTSAGEIEIGSSVSIKIPTGAELRAGWSGIGIAQSTNNSEIEDGDNLSQNLELSVSQPLLRGAGTEVNTASVETAKITENINILNLKSTLIETISNTIFEYRRLLQAWERVKIARGSLERSRNLLEINRVLLEAGRLAPVDLLQNESDVANQEVRLLSAENNFESVRANLLQILDIDTNEKILPAETIELETRNLDVQQLQKLAFENRPEYLQRLLRVEIAKLDLLQAENNRLWDLNLEASLGNGNRTLGSDNTDLRAGIALRHEFGDRTRESNYQRSQVNLQQAETSLEDLRESIEIQVADQVRNVNLLLTQVEQARRARELSEQNLRNQQELLRLGRVSVTEVVRFQEDLVEANNAELNAQIDYLNALTELEQTVGITLETWQVTVETVE